MGEEERERIVTAEGVRDALRDLVREVGAGDPGDLARGLFSDDGDFTRELVRAFPGLLSAAAQAVKSFAESLEKMPPAEGAELVGSSYARVDGGELAEAANAVTRLIIRLHEEDPRLFSAGRTSVVADAVRGVDFGKLRKAIIYRAGEELGTLRGELELLGENPVALVNLFSVVAPIANDALAVLKTVFSILALPAEAMTYALFKILEDVDWRELGEVVNGAAALVVTLHRGNLILGEGSPHSRGPAERISAQLLGALDGEALAEALAALGEEGEVFAVSFARRFLDDQSLLMPLAESSVLLANSALRVSSSALEQAAGMPPEAFAGIARALDEDLEAGELGRALAAAAAIHRRLAEADPGLHARLRAEIIEHLGPELRSAVTPAALAERANRAAAAFNRRAAADPGWAAEGLDEFLGALDEREMGSAAAALRSRAAEAASRHPEAVKALAGALLAAVYGGARGYVRNRWSRGKRRKG